MNFGNVCTMLYVNIAVASLFFSTSALANDDYMQSKEFNDYNSRYSYCYKLSYREINKVDDSYFNSLNQIQKKVLIKILSETAMNKCVAYEEAQFLKYAIRSQDKSALEFSQKISYNNDYIEHNFISALKSLDQKEILRLSETDTFSTPFDRMKLSEKFN